MGVSLVAKIEGVGLDAFKIVADRLGRDYQAPVLERWLLVIRSYRQPVPPLNEHTQVDDQSVSLKGIKQRAMYTVRHSGRSDELVVMIEDPSAPRRTRPKPLRQEPGTPAETSKHTPPPEPTLDQKPVDLSQPNIALSNSVPSTPGDEPLAAIVSTYKPVVEPDMSPEPPSNQGDHHRLSILSVPDSFELLLSATLCSNHAIQPPSSWLQRPNMVLVEGKVWGLYLDPHDTDLANTGPPKRRERQPDWWIRLGTVTNKGAASAHGALPWLLLEVECAAGSLGQSSAFLKHLLHALIRPGPTMVMKPFEPTEQDLYEAGLVGEGLEGSDGTTRPSAGRRNGYCMLMLAKREGLI